MRLSASVLIAACLLSSPAPAQTPAQQVVDVELVLAADASLSMDYDEHMLQRKGYIETFRQADSVARILAGKNGRIAVTFLEFAGDEPPDVAVSWTVIDSAESARTFANRIAILPIQGRQKTSLSRLLTEASQLIESNSIGSERRVIMVSGDGANALGAPMTGARDAVVKRGIVVNGLPIMINKPRSYGDIDNLDAYFEHCVIGGPGAFVQKVTKLQDISDAIVAAANPQPSGQAPAGRLASFDCMAGEKAMAQPQN